MFYGGYSMRIGCVYFFKVLLNVLWRVLVEYRMCVFGNVSVRGVLGGYCMYIMGKVLLCVLCVLDVCIWYCFVECLMASIW